MRFLLGLFGVALLVIGVSLTETGSESARAADRDCSDFSNQAAAQSYFISKGGPSSDPDRLDADGDGVACEDLPCPCMTGGEGGGGGGGKPNKPRAQRIRAKVTDVTDGDTLKVRAFGAKRDRYDVRLIGIDTPEKFGGLECGARKASASMQNLAPGGTRVKLTTDPSQDTFDRYGRLLAYVNRRRDGRDLGRAQIASGWAKVYVYGGNPFQRVRSFRHAARAARNADRGVWDLCGGDFHEPI
ncbi:MAG: thermonuclease family protein [Actinomycetota bacterium]